MISDLSKIKKDAVAAADAEIAEKTASRHAFLHSKIYSADGGFRAGVLNDAETAAIKKNLGKQSKVDMGRDEKRTGDQDMVDYVLSLPKGDHNAILGAIKSYEASVVAAPPRVASSAA